MLSSQPPASLPSLDSFHPFSGYANRRRNLWEPRSHKRLEEKALRIPFPAYKYLLSSHCSWAHSTKHRAGGCLCGDGGRGRERWAKYSLQAASCFCKSSCLRTRPHLFVYILSLYWCFGGVVVRCSGHKA